MNLIEIAKQTRPSLPSRAVQLDPYDRTFFPQRSRVGRLNALPLHRFQQVRLLWHHSHQSIRTPHLNQAFYGYNYNTFTHNIRYRAVRACFPIVLSFIFLQGYTSYRKQVLKTNLFDEYCYLRTQELVKQNEYILKHEGKRVRT